MGERIRALAEETFADRGTKRAPVTVSIGVAELPTHGESAEALLSAADAALYSAKRKGRNRVVGVPALRTRRAGGSRSKPPRKGLITDGPGAGSQ